MKKRDKGLTAATAICAVAFGAYLLGTRMTADHTPPVLTVPETAIQTSVQAEDKNLLFGIQAVDDRDGDISDKVIMEDITGIFEENKITITYAVFDKAGNVSRAQRTVEYTDYAPPKISLHAPLIFRADTDFNIFSAVGASDLLDGNLTGHVRGTMATPGDRLEDPGMHQVEFHVTNSLGDTVRLTLPVEVTELGHTQNDPLLTNYLVYRKVNTPFDPLIYIAGESKGRAMVVTSQVNIEKPGTYTVDYVDQRGEEYGKTRLIVVVEE